ncbi:hypothetical protein SynRS9907_01855 [Synechococcus sp. RS9907]|nr:hypothetical protein SynRS9907_01855 [Synechococcus sp. RS9907]
MTSLEWGSCAGEQIPQTGELLSDRNGDGVFTEENTKLECSPSPTCKWIADA